MQSEPGHDVFVSYAHDDNGVVLGSPLNYGWVTTLAANLNEGPAVLKKRIFIDQQLKPGDAFDNELRDKVQGCSVLLLLLSQNYIDSAWCGQELDYFLRTHGADSPDVFVVELCPFERLELKEKHASIQAIRKRALHTKFWYQPRTASLPLLAGDPSPSEGPPEGRTHYWSVLNELRGALDARVRARRDQRSPARKVALTMPMAAGVAQQSAAPASNAAAAGAVRPRLGTVLLADTTEDLEAQRNAVRAALQPEGIVVLPEGDYVELSPEEFEAAIAADLARADLFVQLLSETAGRKPRGFNSPRPQLQYERAVAAGQPILQWSERLPAADAIADVGHARLFQTEFLRVTHRADFESTVVEHLRAQQARLEREAAAAAAAAAAPTQATPGMPRAATKRLIFIDDAAGEPALSERLRAIVRANNCSLRSLPAGAPLGNNGIDVKELLRPCRAGITVYTDTAKYATAYNRLVFFINQVAVGGLPLERWGVVLQKGTVAEVFGIESDEVVPLDEAGLASFLTSL